MTTRQVRRERPTAASVLTVAAVGSAIAAPFLVDLFTLTLLMNVLVLGLFAASLSLLVGQVGLVSLGHAAHFAVGGYAAAIVARELTPNVFVQMGASITVVALIAAVTGWLAVRSHGVYFLMLTLAFAQIVFTGTVTWTEVTGGSNGLAGIPRPSLGGEKSGTLESVPLTYWYMLTVVLLGVFLLHRLLRSPFGSVLRGIRDNEPRMRSLGYQTTAYKVVAFTVCGGFAAAAGSLAVSSRRFISPSDASFELSVLVLVMVIIGGTRSLWGGFLGALVVIGVQDQLAPHLTGHGLLLLGALFILTVYLAPQGLTGLGGTLRWRGWPLRGGRRGRPGVPDAASVGLRGVAS